ncbi:DEAD/DEAH box helicase family protein, partial [Sharpea azabuensis]|uniref:DEAD/DEAH box helicase family protein n=1 Tax=Sharpea azabuensis TaxID=322505 RepID=UPI0023F3BB1E
EAFIKNILQLRTDHVDKALLLSSTGTGKTIASAFAMQKLAPRRMLFVVHREQIAKQAMRSYQRVFGNTKTYGLLSGTQKNIDADCIFATMQTMSKSHILDLFAPDTFDVIVLDECHHAGAASYQRIMQCFKPHFYLGMTASPDTNNYDIYDLFDHHIAYEIRCFVHSITLVLLILKLMEESLMMHQASASSTNLYLTSVLIMS